MNPRSSERAQKVASTDVQISELLSTADRQFWAGRTTEVLVSVDSIQPAALDASTGVRLRLLRGMASFELGFATDAIASFREALLLAESCAPTVRFGAALALFSRESQFQSPDEALPSLSRLRQLATMLGDAGSLGHLHLAVARLDALRGHCVSARRHLEVSRQLFVRSDKPPAKGIVELVDSGLEMYGGNLNRAIRAARQGLKDAATAELCMPMSGSLANLGSLYICTGQLSHATECLDRAFALASSLTLVRLSVIDSFCQIAVVQGDMARAQDLLRDWSSLNDQHVLPARSWYDLAHQITRCAYSSASKNGDASSRSAEDADPELARRQYKAVRTSLLCAKARALARLGKHGAGRGDLATAVRACPRGAVDPLIVLEATQALCARPCTATWPRAASTSIARWRRAAPSGIASTSTGSSATAPRPRRAEPRTAESVTVRAATSTSATRRCC